uniref:uncharacterized protein LOC122597025 n=1 Tax=Erigeron canadensis TaxID=72917 RepID=UPI001CB95BB3|nr:uncharacterized protein LOC122597025 [Erigeron canadensis]
MGDEGEKTPDSSKNKDKIETSGSNPHSLHPVYTVTNIQHKVRVLDGSKVTYSSWVKLFQLNARGYKVLDHIDGSLPPEETDPNMTSWLEIDAIVLQWIYSTVSDDLLVRILETESTALEAWNRLEKKFLNNKGPRAAALEKAFTNLTLKSMSSLRDYCQKPREISALLADVDQPVSDNRLIIQHVSGLPPEYDVVAAQLHKDLPPWEEAINLLDAEERRQQAHQQVESIVAAAVPDPPPQHSNPPAPRRDNDSRGPNRNNQRRSNSGLWQ